MKLLLTACGLALLGDLVGATHLKIRGTRRSPADNVSLFRRGNVAGSASLNNTGDIAYRTNITLGGVPWPCLIDTGSSDLWVAGVVPGGQDTGVTSGVNYAVGAVQGPVKTAPLQFTDQTVPNQAYIEVPPDADNPAGLGLIGLGPSFGSNILLSSKGNPDFDTVLDRIFRQNRTTPNYMTVLLGRSDDPTDMFPGDITVGSLLTGYESITNEPKVPVAHVPVMTEGDQHWRINVDENGIIGPDGNAIPFTSIVQTSTNKKQATAVLDTGFSLPQVPKSVADAIYGGVKDAQYTKISGLGSVWAIPCNEEIYISFKIGGKTIPIHPLDTSLDANDLGLNLKDSVTGVQFCIGAFQPISFDTGSAPDFDMILGMAFLRNTYLLINHGDFVQGGFNTAPPFVQLLATTNDTAEAHRDFVTVRLNGVDNGKKPVTPSSSNSSSSNRTSGSGLSRQTIYYIVAAAVGAVALLLLCLVVLRFRRRKTRTATSATYAPLSYPAPQSYSQTYNPYAPGQGYQTPYDRRS